MFMYRLTNLKSKAMKKFKCIVYWNTGGMDHFYGEFLNKEEAVSYWSSLSGGISVQEL